MHTNNDGPVGGSENSGLGRSNGRIRVCRRED